MRLLLVGLALVGLTRPAVACINDIELGSYEREFRSQYRGPGAAPAMPSVEPTGPIGDSLFLGAGAVLLTGAVTLSLTGRRSRR